MNDPSVGGVLGTFAAELADPFSAFAPEI